MSRRVLPIAMIAVVIAPGAESGANTCRAKAATVRPSVFAESPLMVVENAGQFPLAVRFQVRLPGEVLWVTDHSLWITRVEPQSHRGVPAGSLRDLRGPDLGLRPVRIRGVN